MKDVILQTGAPILRKKAAHILKKDVGSRELSALIKKMKALLKKEEFGVAIAAPQVGTGLRLFAVAGKVFKEEGEKAPEDHIYINPEIVRLSKATTGMSEGCLSVRGVYGAVKRHEKVTLKAWDESGRMHTINASGLLAQIFQHEVDHLNGILFTDTATNLHDESAS